ncbi:MAG: DUF4199 family protein [Chloroherpetonaceae bacterium]|nr:DUF4199 family protein [Chloroherpetonaceae bacterium]MDW8438747.1 DUF4199 family protein [Chloroherpetonaceae bacterium]
MSEQLSTPSSQPEEPDNFNSALLGGGVILVIGLIPLLNVLNACCLGIMLGGGAAVWHYATRHGLSLTSGEGFKLGALAGLLGGLAGLVVGYVLIALFNYQPGLNEIRDLMLNALGDDPTVRAQLERSFREQEQNALSISNIVLGVIGTAIIYPLFAGLGGVIGAAMFKKSPPSAN